MKGKNIYWFSDPCTKESPPDQTTHGGLWGGGGWWSLCHKWLCLVMGQRWRRDCTAVLTLLTCEGCDEHAHISTT